MKVKRESEVAQSCPTLSDAMDCSLPGYSVHGIFQARVTGVGCQENPQFIVIHTEPYSSTLAWKISWTEEPGRLQSMGSLRVGHD